MKTQKLLKMVWAAILTLAVLALTGRLGTPASVQAQNNRHDRNSDAYRIERGFEIAPAR
jgi:hypothetical protein